MKHVVMFSGGAGSWATALRVREQFGTSDLTLLFADTRIEDPDLYRFLHEAAEYIGVPLTIVSDGRTPWQVFRDVRMIGNSRIAPCSHKLKQAPCRKWLTENTDPQDSTLYVGIDWTEDHRLPAIRRGWAPWTVDAPLTRSPLLAKSDYLAQMMDAGITPPLLYELGAPHNNCGGFCVRAGQAHFAWLLRTFPARYEEHERNEQEMRDYLGADVSILRDRSGGKSRPLTLRAYRERLLAGGEFDPLEWGGCGCFVDAEGSNALD